MIKEKKYLEELIWSDGFEEVAWEVFDMFDFQLSYFEYNEEDDCFYSPAWQTWHDQKYRVKMTVESLEDGGPDDLKFNFWIGNFKNFEEMTDWKDELNFGVVVYKDGEWFN